MEQMTLFDYIRPMYKICYKQYGNSIVVTVLMALFSQLNIAGVDRWNDLSQEAREELIERTTRR